MKDSTQDDELDVNRPSAAWEAIEEARLTIRASALGVCSKALAAISTGEVPGQYFGPQVLRAFEQGHSHELNLLNDWQVQVFADREDYGVEFQVPIYYSVTCKDLDGNEGVGVVTGTMDMSALGYESNKLYVVDAKTVSVNLEMARDKMRPYLLDKYATQLLPYALGVGYGIVPEIHIALGRIDRDSGEQVGKTEVYRYSLAEVEQVFNAKTLDLKVREVYRLSALAKKEGLTALAAYECTPNPFSCPANKVHFTIAPSLEMEATGIPKSVQEALTALDEIRKEEGHAIEVIKTRDAHRRTVKDWLLTRPKDEVLSGKRELGPWETTLSGGNPTEKVSITPDELRKILGASAEGYITETTAPWRLNWKYVGGWKNKNKSKNDKDKG